MASGSSWANSRANRLFSAPPANGHTNGVYTNGKYAPAGDKAGPPPARAAWRNSLGLRPVCSRNTRAKCDMFEKPQASAMSVIERPLMARPTASLIWAL